MLREKSPEPEGGNPTVFANNCNNSPLQVCEMGTVVVALEMNVCKRNFATVEWEKGNPSHAFSFSLGSCLGPSVMWARNLAALCATLWRAERTGREEKGPPASLKCFAFLKSGLIKIPDPTPQSAPGCHGGLVKSRSRNRKLLFPSALFKNLALQNSLGGREGRGAAKAMETEKPGWGKRQHYGGKESLWLGLQASFTTNPDSFWLTFLHCEFLLHPHPLPYTCTPHLENLYTWGVEPESPLRGSVPGSAISFTGLGYAGGAYPQPTDFVKEQQIISTQGSCYVFSTIWIFCFRNQNVLGRLSDQERKK